jgi:hypothetical protein
MHEPHFVDADGYAWTLPSGRRKQSKPGYPFHFTCPHFSQSDPYFFRNFQPVFLTDLPMPPGFAWRT